MIKWISLLTVAALLMAFCGCHATPAESLTPLEELYREQETLAQPVLEEYQQRLEEAVEAAEDGNLLSVRINEDIQVTDKALIDRLLAALKKFELKVTEQDDVLFGENGFNVTFIYTDKEVYLGNWTLSQFAMKYPSCPDAPFRFAIDNINDRGGELATAYSELYDAFDIPLPDYGNHGGTPITEEGK